MERPRLTQGSAGLSGGLGGLCRRGVLIASNTGGQTLYWGLGASVVGFVLNCFLVAPKRDVGIVDEMEPVDAGEEGAE